MTEAIFDQAFQHYAAIRAPQGSEAAIERIAIVMCAKPEIWEIMGWPDVTSIDRQVKLGGAIADIVLRHRDDSITILEVKKGGLTVRDYCTGIGQLLCQAVLGMSAFHTLKVRTVLALPGPVEAGIVFACDHASIDILPLCTEDQWLSSVEAVRAAWPTQVDSLEINQPGIK